MTAAQLRERAYVTGTQSPSVSPPTLAAPAQADEPGRLPALQPKRPSISLAWTMLHTAAAPIKVFLLRAGHANKSGGDAASESAT
ncbi:hypothetical protein PF001_g33004, partial [Phytophthora fragariae]